MIKNSSVSSNINTIFYQVLDGYFVFSSRDGEKFNRNLGNFQTVPIATPCSVINTLFHRFKMIFMRVDMVIKLSLASLSNFPSTVMAS